jgi:hypothetical protein
MMEEDGESQVSLPLDNMGFKSRTVKVRLQGVKNHSLVGDKKLFIHYS